MAGMARVDASVGKRVLEGRTGGVMADEGDEPSL